MPRYEFDLSVLDDLPKGVRERAISRLREFNERRVSNPLEIYQPYPKQAQHHRARTSIRAFFGGNRAGKTTSGVCDDLIEVTPEELLPAHLREFKRPEWVCPRYIRVVAPSNKLIGSVIEPMFRAWTPRELLKGGRFGDSYSKYDKVLALECGCRLDLMSYEMDLDKFGGAVFHRAHYDEEPPEEIREECRARLTDFNGTEQFSMTPLLGMTWMFDGVWQRHLDGDRDVHAVVASMLDNPYLDPDGVRATLREYEGNEDLMAARVFGRFVHFGGLVYPAWRDYLGDPPDAAFVRSCDVVVGIDPGVVGFALVFVAFDAENHAIVFDCRKLVGGDVEDAVQSLREVSTAWGLDWKRLHYVIDPSARSRSAITSATIETEFNNFGVYPNHGQNEREAGVLMVRRRGAKGALSISRDLAEMQWELQRYRKQERSDGKFDVIKEHDHLMDALRYAIMERPWIQRVAVRPPQLADGVATGPPRRRREVSVMGPMA